MKKEIMLFLQNLSYIHPNKELLFEAIYLTVNSRDKIALVGNNGTGKSTLLKIIAGELTPHEGQLILDTTPYYIPQLFGQYNHLTVAQALRIDTKLLALQEILAGNVTEQYLAQLNDDWTIEERCQEALQYWQLNELLLTQPMASLSGGQKTKVFLAGIHIHQPQLVLLDEPSNHLDTAGRDLLYEFITTTSCALVVVSHDRKLLNGLPAIGELSKRGLTMYGGNYDFYAEQKLIENNALSQDIHSKEKALRKAKEKERETMERQQKLDARGKRKQEKAGVARIMMNTLRNSAENSTAKIKGAHGEKISGISEELQALRNELPDIDKMQLGFDNTTLHQGKMLFSATGINQEYDKQRLWKADLDLQINSGERIALKGLNGSGKTTLIKIILGELEPTIGFVYRADNRNVYIDQDYSLISNQQTVYEQALQFNKTGLQEHEIKIRLNRFLFSKDDWDKKGAALSGGERMRLMLCCLTIGQQAPDIIMLDEPTNNLDIQNIEILTAAINTYKGTLLIVSHDEHFLEQVNVNRTINV
ncbi:MULTISPECIES: ABC-F family ATP-binding cassette domain-containing protein [Niastella]|uniref:ABC-F family ATP-binding cassette domain-containing protein n=1 Tax=Niastella soli TaxID=2821487 RepID=A0ABS3YUI8_9BACT|nr:ABC-F family ATP-binding cassette domain-containing protein [Niastella soli]MBO9201602.1 ABC-F family ATP-binding cassette domain-containing protein [Niastella soli]